MEDKEHESLKLFGRLSLLDLQSITEDFSQEKVLGSGGFGVVHKVCIFF